MRTLIVGKRLPYDRVRRCRIIRPQCCERSPATLRMRSSATRPAAYEVGIDSLFEISKTRIMLR